MNKKRMLVTISAGLLALSALGGTTFAHWGLGNAEAVQEKVAEELGQYPETVAQAFATAVGENRAVAIASKLAKLLESGAITQAEADEIQAWHDAAPSSLAKIKKAGPHVDLERVAEILGVDGSTLESAAGTARNEMATAVFLEKLNAAVADGRITEEKAAEKQARFENRPQHEFGQGHPGKHKRGFGTGHRGKHSPGGFGRWPHDFQGLQGLAPQADDSPVVGDPTGLTA